MASPDINPEAVVEAESVHVQPINVQQLRDAVISIWIKELQEHTP